MGYGNKSKISSTQQYRCQLSDAQSKTENPVRVLSKHFHGSSGGRRAKPGIDYSMNSFGLAIHM